MYLECLWLVMVFHGMYNRITLFEKDGILISYILFVKFKYNNHEFRIMHNNFVYSLLK